MASIKTVTRFPAGQVALPSSKSISHRAVICAALSDGVSRIRRLSFSDDLAATVNAMQALGSSIKRSDDGLVVEGGRASRSTTLDCGESGTTLRFLIPVAALSENTNTFTGRGRLLQRPLEPFLAALSAHGVSCSAEPGALHIRGPLQAGIFSLPGDISSQFVSGLLLALPLLESSSEIHLTTPLQSAAYVDLTLEEMARFGVRAENEAYHRFIIPGGQHYRPAERTLEADYSQAAFFLVAGALGQEVTLTGLNPASRQGDQAITAILEASGIPVEISPEGGVRARPGLIRAQTVDVGDIPDLVPPLAALFACAEGVSRLTDAARLRHKESDRLQAVSSALTALGADISADEDSLTIVGRPALTGGRMDSQGDHRIAMMGAVAALRCRHPVEIIDSDCVAKSYPDFWRDFEKTEHKLTGEV
jgi:3-phosphoshikimate 1-carboxyvinyltransferase